MMRGLIYYENCCTPMPIGCLPSHRPVLVMTDKPGSGGMVTVVPLKLEVPWDDNEITHVEIETRCGHSVAIVEQVRSVPAKALSRAPKDRADDNSLDKVERALLTHLGIEWEEA